MLLSPSRMWALVFLCGYICGHFIASFFVENPEVTLSQATAAAVQKASMSSPEFLRIGTSEDTLISSLKCDGEMKNLRKYGSRSCSFKNVCFDKNDRKLMYFSPAGTPEELHANKEKYALLYDSELGPIVQPRANFTHSKDRVFLKMVTQSEQPPRSSLSFQPGIFCVREGQEYPNFGHILWDVLFGIYSTLRNLMIPIDPSRTHLILGSMSARKTSSVFLKKLSFLLTDHPIQTFDRLLENQTEHICFEELVLIPTSQRDSASFRQMNQREGNANWLKSSLYYEFRNLLFASQGLDPFRVPTQHAFTFIRKQSSDAFGAKSLRAIQNLDEIVYYISSKFPHIPVQVIEPPKLSLKEQLDIISNTTILITPCGGISALIPFLSPGSTVIVTDYQAIADHRGYRKGWSVSMEADLWDALPYIYKLYYQVFREDEWVWDDPNPPQKDTRRYASVIVDTNRLKSLVDKALTTMSL